jgi:hypothetical protein
MVTYQRIGLVLVWVLSLAIVGAIVSAQTRREPGDVISGSDIGFRPEGWRGTARTGTWVVRINGQWVEAAGTAAVRPATH